MKVAKAAEKRADSWAAVRSPPEPQRMSQYFAPTRSVVCAHSVKLSWRTVVAWKVTALGLYAVAPGIFFASQSYRAGTAMRTGAW